MSLNFSIVDLVFIGLGAYGIIRGIMILMTGKLSASEEARAREFSLNGQRRYKLLSAVLSIIAGVLVLIMSVVRMLNNVDPTPFRIGILIAVAVMIVAYYLVLKSCKNMK